MNVMNELKQKIREVPDFPKAGILFYDLTTLLGDREGLRMAIDALTAPFEGQEIDQVLGIESRGFIFAPTVAYRLGAGFVPVRKPGKLPYKIISASYKLEYGEDSVEIHEDAIKPGQRVLIIDDLIATGGTAAATVQLVEALGGVVVGLAFLVELESLKGREKLAGHEVFSLLKY